MLKYVFKINSVSMKIVLIDAKAGMNESQPTWLSCSTINGNFRAKSVKSLAILVSVGLLQAKCKTNKNIDKHFMMLFLCLFSHSCPGLFSQC